MTGNRSSRGTAGPNQHGTAWDFKKDVLLDDMTLYAKWRTNDYSVTLDPQGGFGGTESITVGYGASMPSASAPTRSGYIFDGYYDDLSGRGTAYYSDTMKSLRTWDKSEPVKLYAKWRDYFVVGDIGPSGGLIFYDRGSYSEGWRYLEAAAASYEYSEKVWGGNDISVAGTGTAIGTGKSNTEKIVAKFGTSEPNEKKADYAAKVCFDMVMTKDGVVYDDWFLPSKDELDLMYENLHRKDLGSFTADIYWSSSGYLASSAYSQNFHYGDQAYGNRDYGCGVRPVLAF